MNGWHKKAFPTVPGWPISVPPKVLCVSCVCVCVVKRVVAILRQRYLVPHINVTPKLFYSWKGKRCGVRKESARYTYIGEIRCVLVCSGVFLGGGGCCFKLSVYLLCIFGHIMRYKYTLMVCFNYRNSNLGDCVHDRLTGTKRQWSKSKVTFFNTGCDE